MTKSQLRAARAAASTTCVIYVRVSTEEQAKSGLGLAAQESECRAYAERQGLTIAAVIVEAAVSGKVHPARRQGFSEALRLLESATAGLLLVRRMDRVSRRLEHQLNVFALIQRDGWAVATTDGKVDTSSAAGRFQVQILAAAAEYELGLISERTREGLASKRAAGERLGRAVQISADVEARIVSEREQGHSMRAIAQGLTSDGIATTGGAAAWSHATVQTVLARHRQNAA